MCGHERKRDLLHRAHVSQSQCVCVCVFMCLCVSVCVLVSQRERNIPRSPDSGCQPPDLEKDKEARCIWRAGWRVPPDSQLKHF